MKAFLWRRVFMVISISSSLCFSWESSKLSTFRGSCHTVELKYHTQGTQVCHYYRTEDPYSFVFQRATGIHTCNFQIVKPLFRLAPCFKHSSPECLCCRVFNFLPTVKLRCSSFHYFPREWRYRSSLSHTFNGQLIHPSLCFCANSGILHAAILYFLCICNFQLKSFCGIWLRSKVAKKNNYKRSTGHRQYF